MWECPDIIQLDDKMFLICCPQGIEQNGIDYENIYQNGYFTLTKDENGLLKAENFKELDKGFDFYAPQSFTDDKGRRILIGWMGIPDADYDNLEKDEKWIHCLSLPRQLTLKNGKINQYPIREILDLLKNPQSVHLKANQAADLSSPVFVLNLNVENKDFTLTIRKDVKLVYSHEILSLELGKSGAGRTARHIKTENLQTLEIFSDHSSLEIFINKGEECFTTRVYDDTKDLKILSDVSLDGTLYEVEPFEIDYSKAL